MYYSVEDGAIWVHLRKMDKWLLHLFTNDSKRTITHYSCCYCCCCCDNKLVTATRHRHKTISITFLHRHESYSEWMRRYRRNVSVLWAAINQPFKGQRSIRKWKLSPQEIRFNVKHLVYGDAFSVADFATTQQMKCPASLCQIPRQPTLDDNAVNATEFMPRNMLLLLPQLHASLNCIGGQSIVGR